MRHLTLCLCLLAGSAQATPLAIDFVNYAATPGTYTHTHFTDFGTFNYSGDLPLIHNGNLDYTSQTIPPAPTTSHVASLRTIASIKTASFGEAKLSITNDNFLRTISYPSGESFEGLSTSADASLFFETTRTLYTDGFVLSDPALDGLVSLNGTPLSFSYPPFSSRLKSPAMELAPGSYELSVTGYTGALGNVSGVLAIPEPSSVVLLVGVVLAFRTSRQVGRMANWKI